VISSESTITLNLNKNFINKMINSIRYTFQEVRQFLKNPQDKRDLNSERRVNSKQLFSLLAIDIAIMVILMSMILILEEYEFIEIGGHKMTEIIESTPAWSVILLGVFIVPFFEELIFRAYIRLKYNLPVQFIILIASSFGKSRIKSVVEDKWHTYYKSLFYLSALIFAIAHLTNYDDLTSILFFIPLLIAPQFTLGLFSGYMRVKFGFIWGFYLHCLHNFVFLAIPLIFMSGSVEKLNVTNDNYQLIIEETAPRNLDSESFIYGSDSLFFEDVKMKALLAQLLDKDEKLIEFSSDEQANKRINLQFRKYSDSIESKHTILEEMQNAYQFKIQKSDLTHSIWQLQIADTALLYKHKKVFKTSSKINISDKEVKMENVSLSQLTENINSNYEYYIMSDIDLNDRFNFEFQKMKFIEFQMLLKNKYGLCLKLSEMEAESVKVDFYEM